MSAPDTDNPLDGSYKITTITNYQGPLEKRSDGQTEIRNGQTSRYDEAGCHWTSTFEIIDDTTVLMTSVADPAESDIDFALRRRDGSPTLEPITYQSRLKLKYLDDNIQMSGTIEYGDELVLITMRKIGD